MSCDNCHIKCIVGSIGKQGPRPNPHMLDHLLEFEPDILPDDGKTRAIEKHTTAQVIDAQVSTADFLASLGSPDTDTVISDLEQKAARTAFNAVVTQDESAHHKLATIETPAAVRHLVGMLTAYDWEFVQQAKQIRGYTVAKLVEETNNPNASIRLKALVALGKVTEVGLFTEKVEVKKTDLTEEEIDKKLKEKLAKFMAIEDAAHTDIEDVDSKQLSTNPNDDQPTADA